VYRSNTGEHKSLKRAPDVKLRGSLLAVTAGRADGLSAFVNPVNAKIAPLVAEVALKYRLPSSFNERLFMSAGGLFSYGSRFADTFKRSAVIIDKILKGSNPGELSIQQPITFKRVLNLKTAKTLGLMIAA
jgi:putative ABC transport system substrate-binding protein